MYSAVAYLSAKFVMVCVRACEITSTGQVLRSGAHKFSTSLQIWDRNLKKIINKKREKETLRRVLFSFFLKILWGNNFSLSTPWRVISLLTHTLGYRGVFISRYNEWIYLILFSEWEKVRYNAIMRKFVRKTQVYIEIKCINTIPDLVLYIIQLFSFLQSILPTKSLWWKPNTEVGPNRNRDRMTK